MKPKKASIIQCLNSIQNLRDFFTDEYLAKKYNSKSPSRGQAADAFRNYLNQLNSNFKNPDLSVKVSQIIDEKQAKLFIWS